MKKLLLASAATALLAGAASAEDVKLGILIGFTGPIESLTGHMANAAELAMSEANASGKVANGMVFVPVRADSTCGDAAAGTAAAERLVTAEGIKGMVGGDCSGVTGAVLQNVARPNGIVMISPSATSPALTAAEDDGLFFRTAPSDAREGEVMADILMEKGVKSIALTYTNNDYGKGLAEAIAGAFTAKGGVVTINVPHEDGKADYSAEVAALAAAGGDLLVVAGYLDQGGKGIIQNSLDTGAFTTFGLPGGMVGDNLPLAIGPALDGSYGQVAQSDSPGAAVLTEMGKTAAATFDATSPYSMESYDAAALLMLAIQAAGSSDPKVYKDKVLDVANAPGEKILPGEIGKALELIAQGVDIDYDGASGVELIGPGEAAGRYKQFEVKGGKFETVTFR
ncbi:MAG: branched-chain amino acid ABC transporter substrate-binding protein [Rhodobacterales bacterium RIFCSPHIGHO2_02_FULL_62_130]|jgi:branched-chain amino acid transport system substrate-binding protein|nr:MAG: branched-chain amino acid ABC transporter substrate-binding protein [Rhodobacterales bacterium RIFCSPHIGHO2_02_FULL_62_130]OHC56476.1 MAG: branched-chain amino acid ABC transporter substrate-binding protein [Rhodobacterales bacterium RIFCSPHIGHO2_12_FULL_62_75]